MVISNFDQQTGILKSTFKDIVTINQIVDYIKATKDNKSYPRKLKILTDAIYAEMRIEPQDLQTIVDENNQSLKNYEYIVDAIIIDSPKETALSVLYKDLANNDKYRFKIFSTRESAFEWLTNI